MKTPNLLLSPLYKLLELPAVYALSQIAGKPTTDRYRLLATNVKVLQDSIILDLGCGVGAFRDCFPSLYVGIDINVDYLKRARVLGRGTFAAMDCNLLAYPDESFSEVVTIATTHHLDDDQLTTMVNEALRVCRPSGHFHIIDAIFPISWNPLKSMWFSLDRGGYPRNLDVLLAILGRAGTIGHHEVMTGPLHDVVYVSLSR